MATITNISPLGDLIIPALNNLIVKAGESVDVSDEAAASLLEQSGNWASSKAAPASAPADSTPTTSPADSIPAASN
jgi:hypothetical protein